MKCNLLVAFLLFFCLPVTFAQVTVTSSDSVDCVHRTTTLTAHLIGDTPNDSRITTDDYYSGGVESIGFTFNFYGTNYAKCLIGPNGTICFDTTLVGAYENWQITGPLAGTADVYNSICGPWCDIDFADYGGTCTYSTDGTAPYRKFVVTFCHDFMYNSSNCPGQFTTTQIILYETTNLIETHIAHKTICTAWNNGYAIVGVQNATGSASTVAPGRDFPATWSVIDEAWQFTPTGGGTAYTVASIPYAPVPYASSNIYWYDATTNAYLGSGFTLNVSPTTTTIYKAGGLGCADTSFGYYAVVPTRFLTVTMASTDPTVCQGTDGTITIGALTPGQVDTIRYMKAGVPQAAVIATVSAAGTITITGLSAAVYNNIIVTEGTCVSAPLTITLVNPPITVTVLTHTDPTVCGYADGTITLTGLVGATSYLVNYDFNSVAAVPVTISTTTAGTLTITGLLAGVYTNIATTGGPCPTSPTGPVTLGNPPPPTVTVDSAVVKTCVGIPVLLHAYAAPTGIPYNYTWTPPTYLSSSTSANPTVNPAAAGDVIYTVTANPGTDPGCAGSTTVRVHTLPPFVLNNVDTVICLGHFVQASITGSNEFSYLWSPTTGVSNPNLKTPTIAPVVSTNYIVTASYAHCPDMVQGFNIEVDTMAHPLNIVDTICLGMTDNFDLTVPGSGPGGNYYHYQWLLPSSVDVSDDTSATAIITPTTLGPHTYSVTVSPRAASCSVNDIINIWVLPNAITVQPTDTMICKGKSVQAIGFGGNPAFNYQWIPTAGIAVSNVFNAFITPDTSALYTVTAAFHRCPDIHATLNLSVQPTPQVYIGGNRLLCQFDTLHIRASVLPAWYGGYSYSWTPAADLDNTTSASVVFSGNSNTKLFVTVTTPAGCTSNDSANITVFPGNFASMVPDHNSFCPHTSTALLPAGPAGVSYHWYPSLYLDDSVGGSPVITPVSTQVYTVIATTTNGCKDTFNYTATVFPAAVMLLADSVTLFPGETYHMQPSTNCTSFLWFPPAGLSNIYTSDPEAAPQISTKYSVKGTTENGCEIIDSIDVIVNEESTVSVPNAFTPGTGINNEFKALQNGIVKLNFFRVFDRWGALMFETTDINQGWDGSFKGKPQPFGVYVYEYQAVTSSGKAFTRHGNVTLLR